MKKQLSPEARLAEMVERIMARTRAQLPEALAQIQSAKAAVKAAEENLARAREHGLTKEAATEAWKAENKRQLKTAWTQIKRSSRFGFLLYIGYLLARPDVGFVQIALLALFVLAFLGSEYQERKEIMAETERAIDQQASRLLVPLEEKHASLERDLEDVIFALAAVERKTRSLPAPS